MEILTIIDKITELRPVRWALLILTVALLVLLVIVKFQLSYSRASLTTEKAANVELRASIEVQNKAVKRMQEEGAVMANKVKDAQAMADKAQQALKKKAARVSQIPIREDCCGALEDAKAAFLGGAL